MPLGMPCTSALASAPLVCVHGTAAPRGRASSFQGSDSGSRLLTTRIFLPFTEMCESSTVLARRGARQHALLPRARPAHSLSTCLHAASRTLDTARPACGGALHICVERAERGVVLQQVRRLLHAACAPRPAAQPPKRADTWRGPARHSASQRKESARPGRAGVVDDHDVQVAVVAALHAAQEVAACGGHSSAPTQAGAVRSETARRQGGHTDAAKAVDGHVELLALALGHLLCADGALRRSTRVM